MDSYEGLKSPMAIQLETVQKSLASRIQIIIELYNTTIKTGKRGRPKKLLTMKQVNKLLKELTSGSN